MSTISSSNSSNDSVFRSLHSGCLSPPPPISDLHWTGLCDDWGHRSIVTTIVTSIVTAQCLVVVALALKTDCDCYDQGISSLHSDSAARLILGMLYPARHEVFAMSGAPRYASQIFVSEICFPDLCLQESLQV